MSTEFNLCPKCGGIKDPIPVAYPRAFGLCRCTPATKHDGKLDREGGYQAYHTLGRDRKTPYVVVEGKPGPYTCEDTIQMSPAQALSLLAWLQQEKPELERLAKEQEG